MLKDFSDLKKEDEKPGEEEQAAGESISLNFAVHATPSQVTEENLEFKEHVSEARLTDLVPNGPGLPVGAAGGRQSSWLRLRRYCAQV